MGQRSELDLANLGLSVIPDKVFECKKLRKLDLRGNHLITVPEQIGRLGELRTLLLDGNDIEVVASKLALLKKLQVLSLSSNKLTSFPLAICGLKGLRHLTLADNQVAAIPVAVADMSDLVTLDLGRNRLTCLPDALGSLHQLESLSLCANELVTVTPALGRLSRLALLDLSANALAEVPSELEGLTSLRALDLRDNPLQFFPPELGRIKCLTDLEVGPQAIANLPPDVLLQGTTAVLSYLRSLLDENAPVFPYQAKVVIVGQGSVGKTCLLNNLHEQPVLDYQGKTEGVEIRPLLLNHPTVENQMMTLSIWDFGGQEIQHATHQFFLTSGSLFLLLWNSRQDAGKSGGNLQYWLEMIEARAPDSPIFLIATHCDQEPLRTSAAYWQEHFKNVRAVFEVGNLERNGIAQLKEAIRLEAAQLPLMHDAWNRRWRDARNALKAIDRPYVSPEEAWKAMRPHNVDDEECGVIARRMHLLGDLVYIHDNPVLKDTIVLDAEWLTKRVCEAVSSDGVQRNRGVLTNEMLERIWPGEVRSTREELLNFMEQYDLSYRTLEARNESIVVQALPDSPPERLLEAWRGAAGPSSLQLRYRFRGTLPPGIPSWFIARAHRFTMNLHWRFGALFSDRSGEHKALVQLTETAGDVNVLLAVKGPEPIKFFSVLQDGFEETLKRYPGIQVQRMVPCPGTVCEDRPCTHEFSLESLDKYRKKGLSTIKCAASTEDYSVMELLYGMTVPRSEQTLAVWREIADSLGDRIEAKIDLGVDKLESSIREILGFQQREFTKVFRAFQSQESTHSPSVFVIEEPPEGWSKRTLSGKLTLRLCCEMPGCWHVAEGGTPYEIADPAHWLTKVAPFFRGLVQAFKIAAPIAGAAAEFAFPAVSKEFASTIKLSQELAKLLPEIELEESLVADDAQMNKAAGVAYQFLRELLVAQDPYLLRTGLQKVLTAERDYLWLCPLHAQESNPKPVPA